MHSLYHIPPGLVRRLLLAGCFLSLTLLPVAQAQNVAVPAASTEVGRPFITNYHPSEYGASVQNWAVVQDDRGVMYFGNNSGVLEYDGATWRLIEVPNRTVIRSMAKAPDGRIYVGAVGDLGFLAPDSVGQMQFVSLRAAVPEPYRDFADVWGTDVIGGDVYFNVSQYLFRWDGEIMRVWPAEVGFHLGMAVDSTYYARQWDVGLMRLEGDELRLVPGGERFAQERLYVMLPFGDGRILLGTRTQGLFLYDGEHITPFETEVDAQLQQTGLYLPGAVLSGGRFALGTFSDGVYVVDRKGRLVEHIDRTAGLQDNVVLYTYVDREGALWLALDNGLARVEIDAPLSYYAAADGLTSNVLSLERHDGTLYVGTSTGLFRLDAAQGRFREVPGAGIQIFDLLSVEGDLLLATFDGLQRLDGERTRFIRRAGSGAFVTNRLHRSKQDSSRVFVSATGIGLSAIRHTTPGTWVVEGTVPGTDVEFWSIAELEPGTLWLGTSANGVLRVRFPQTDDGAPPLDAAEVTAYGSEHGLPSSSVQVAAVGERLFFLTKDGLFRFDPDAERFAPDSSTFAGIRTSGDPEEWTMLEDDAGRVWMNFGRETAVAYPQADGTYRVDTAPFRRFAGTSSAALYPEASGAVWINFLERLVRVDFGSPAEEASVFPALVRRVATSEGHLLYGGAGASSPPSLPFAERGLRFEYAAPRFVEAGRTEYRVWLEGFDAHAGAWVQQAVKEYTNLPPGAYTFHVRARAVSGQESTEAAYAFRVLAPWYRTPWAYLLYVLGVGALVVGLVQMRTHHLQARSRALEQVVRERTSELEQRVEELAVINSIQRGLVAKLDMQAIYDLVGDRVRDLFDAQVVVIRTFDYEKRTEHIRYGVEKGERFYLAEAIPADAFTRHLMGLREPVLVNEDFAGYVRGFDDSSDAVWGEVPRSALFIPMIVGDSVLGNVSLQNVDQEHAFTEADVRLLTTLTNSMSVALQNARLFAETRQQATELDTVNRVSRALVAQLDFDVLIPLVGEQVRQTFQADIAYVALLDREAGMISFPYVYGEELAPIAFGEGLTSRIIRTGEPLLLNEDVRGHTEQMGIERVGKQAASYLGVPIQTDKGTLGVISVQSTERENVFAADDLRLLSTIAANVGVALQNAEAYRQLGAALTELKRTQAQLVQQEKLASLGALTAGIAHEIKNPLNFVNNFAAASRELVDELAHETDPREVQALLTDLRLNAEKIEKHGRRADSIVRSMMQHARGGSAERQPVELNRFVEEYVELAWHGRRATAPEFTVEIVRDYGAEVGSVEVVPQDLGRALINLLSNAFDAVSERAASVNGQYAPRLVVSTRRSRDGGVEIHVADNGPGIPAEVREKIFEPFFTTKPTGEGTGLGLSLAYDIVTQGHGGALTVESEEGQGAAFVVTLPAADHLPRRSTKPAVP